MNKRSFIRSCFHQFMTPRECELEGHAYGFHLSRGEIERFYKSFEVEAEPEELPADLLDNWENANYAYL